MKICKQCGKQYMNIYTLNRKGKNKYTSPTDFCSKSCAVTFVRGSLTKEKIEAEIINFVTSKNKYCLKSEVLQGIHRSSKTLTKFGIDFVKIQSILGFSRSRSIFQERVYSELKKYFTNIICEYSNDKIISPKGYKLYIDFFIPDYCLMIEADGKHHNDAKHPWYSKYNNECDFIKNEYCKRNRITMIRIPYKQIISKKYIKQYLENHLRAFKTTT